jgi:uncharacterized transporter YbjL
MVDRKGSKFYIETLQLVNVMCIYTEVPGKVAGNSIELKIYMFRGAVTTTKDTPTAICSSLM